MPFYEYQCKSCGHDLEAMQKISDPPLKKCPQCGKSQLQRLMSAPVFRLKGGGWYETDFKGDQDNKRNLADRPEADSPKESPKDAAKDAPAAGAEGKGKDAKGAEGKGSEGKVEAAAPKDKPADKPAGKPSPEPAKKSHSAKRSSGARTSSHGKSAAKRPIKRAVHKAKRRI
jgi:putative FmdB family regulatory protein